jgi:hypothetical protein
MLNSYVFLSDAHEENVNYGPELLVRKTMADGRLSSCVSKTAAKHFLRRDVRGDEMEWLDELNVGFVTSDYRYRELVKAIVTSESYRRLR